MCHLFILFYHLINRFMDICMANFMVFRVSVIVFVLLYISEISVIIEPWLGLSLDNFPWHHNNYH